MVVCDSLIGPKEKGRKKNIRISCYFLYNTNKLAFIAPENGPENDFELSILEFSLPNQTFSTKKI
ncbi:MAG: hypothetical protein ABR84_07955 [Cryomorphaceae bacterium BACL21 MAG-121220-bin10]|nr:MAG: hypothetical protein ABR84_07955 [Cryomorphaceae bacterium BACL21 MAG-121220-bin10]|tara:strand:- start:13004 stop:13198 length:195 start_codon:yes stop_codon:yes gene_type:complete